MTENHNLIVDILIKYSLHQPLNQEEQQIFAAWRKESDANRRLADCFGDPNWVAEHRRQLHETPTEEIWADIQRHISQEEEPGILVEMAPLSRIVRYKWLVRASVFLIFCCAGAWAWHSYHSTREIVIVEQLAAGAGIPNPLMDERYRYQLILDDGRIIYLDTLPINTVVVETEKWILRKTDSNTIVYIPVYPKLKSSFYPGEEMGSVALLPGVTAWHRLTVTRGTLRVQFTEHSEICLNKASSLLYPTDLSSGKLTLSGEAFFDIIHDENRQLEIIAGNGIDVKLLGTKLDVQSYSRENEGKVTVYSDSAKVESGNSSVVVHEHSEAILTEGQPAKVRQLKVISDEPDWIKPHRHPYFFEFKDTPLMDVIKEIADRYGLTVINPENVKSIAITGRLRDDQPLDAKLQAIEEIERGFAYLRVKADTIFIMLVKP